MLYINIAIIVLVAVLLILTIVLIIKLKNFNFGTDNDMEKQFRFLKEDIERGFKNTREEINNILGSRIENFSAANELKLEHVRKTVEDKLTNIEKENSKKLEEMRTTVDEKLHNTLEKRLGESFKQVSDQLESVYKGLGEMQNLAVGVGDLKKVLTNVKQRGSWGEIQLGNILEDYLTNEQYVKNAKIKPKSKEMVEFAIKIPDKIKDNQYVLLPVDSKYPTENYERLLKAEESGDLKAITDAQKALALNIKKCAMDIRDKYVDPPTTTDFGVMFLPTESLYCEILRNSALVESLRKDYHVVVTGPTTLTAFISSLQVGFKALAIEKQTSNVWKILISVQKEFENFGSILSKTNKKIQELANTISDAESKTRNIQSKLNKVDTLAFSSQKFNLIDSIDIKTDNTENESENSDDEDKE